jgi:alkylhydroperoxidase family enzyme
VEEGEAKGTIAALYERFRREDGHVADIVKTFSGTPEALEAMYLLSTVHFRDEGALSRAQREMIATHVTRLLGCHY